MFKPLPDRRDRTVTVTIEGRSVTVPEGQTVAAAVLAADLDSCRTTAVSGSPRAPYCMMGLCFDCLMEVDGVPNTQACLTEVRDGMTIRRQQGARKVTP
ncbi:MAG: (2Fe-2S)-binding protein [Rhodospirillales bacterium]|nr:(2Fe-2S)-binding protein [Rhodospirillales bacterium]